MTEGTVTVGSGGVPSATLLDPAGVTVAAAHSPDPVLSVREPRLWWVSADYPSKRGMSVLKVRQDAPDGCSRRSWR